jgi:methionyl-tRNA formyltransferase
MRVAFAGTPSFAARALAALVEAGHEITLVLTQPDRAAGRGLRMRPSAVSEWAEGRGFAISKPGSLKEPGALEDIRGAAPQVMVVAAYGLILPAGVLEIPPLGCLNIHASLLPRWRGAAPIQRALLAGDGETGISIMRMDAGLDTGPVLLTRRLPIGERDTAGSLTEALSSLGAEAIVEALRRLPALVAQPQDGAHASYAAKLQKSEARIDWARSSAAIDRQVRAFNPVPGAETWFRGENLKVWEAELATGHAAPGTVLEADGGRLVVASGDGAVRLMKLQRPGGRRLAAADFLHGAALQRGSVLGDKPLASA